MAVSWWMQHPAWGQSGMINTGILSVLKVRSILGFDKKKRIKKRKKVKGWKCWRTKRYWTWMLQNAVTPLIRSVKILHVLPHCHCIIPGSVNVPMFYCDKPWISWRNPGLAVTSEHSDYMTPRFTLTRSVTAPSHGRWIVIDVDNSFRERRPAVLCCACRLFFLFMYFPAFIIHTLSCV